MENLLRCPITREIMWDPVTLVDGQTYEREALEEWLKKNKTSPLTNKQLRNTDCDTNMVIKNIIDEYLKQNPHKKNEQYFPSLLTIFKKHRYETLLNITKIRHLDLININSIDLNLFFSYAPTDIIKHVLDNLDTLDEKSYRGDKLMHIIALSQNTEIVVYATIKLSYQLNSKNLCNITPFMYACEHQPIEIINMMLKNGADHKIDDIKYKNFISYLNNNKKVGSYYFQLMPLVNKNEDI